ncbi:hypothetical protein ABN034_30105 [Actinopolymorpha sp. B11F2]|uniref:hypothetical protein n=1 Tax=Actinopolymorpha sp. B11F2 TaxID=3160862 RepID=UPI0032E4DF33
MVDVDGNRRVATLQVHWTTYAKERLVYRDAWLHLTERMESLVGELGIPLARTELVWQMGKRLPAGGRWSQTRFDKLVAGFEDENQDLRLVATAWTWPGRVEPEEPAQMSVDARLKNPDDGEEVYVEVRTKHLTPEEEDRIAEEFASLLVPVAESVEAVWGAVIHDLVTGFAANTPFESWYALGWDGRRAAKTHPRGYYWANLLNATHVERLGGLESLVERGSPQGLLVQPINEGRLEGGAVVRIPSPVTRFTTDELRAVKDLLAPALLPVTPRRYRRRGTPRILPD